ncbi:MFS transporter [Nocardia jejuensis]|uniref:MFS transporter n=1 Tax=Nocardia jejuensis TaxID=328049 RepID=UPI0008299F6F|nr:MFS transporter [Nocardia jejuensis]
MTRSPTATAPPSVPAATGIWGRQLDRFPGTAARTRYLAITIAATVVLYYQLYAQGTVATKVIADLGMSLTYFIVIQIVGGAIGAIGSLAAGLADRWGRANLVVYGLVIVSLLMLFAVPEVGGATSYLMLFALISGVEGVVLVATPALIRDFSPQLGRASAMGFWTLGPVLGSLLATAISSSTLDEHPRWQFQFQVAGIIGWIVFVAAFIWLRELAPALRDQLMVSLRDRALLEARARDLDPESVLRGHWHQMLHARIVLPAMAISSYLLFYYLAVGFFVLFYVTTYGYSEARANALANWYWIANALTLVIFGALSDLIRVRKPFMLIGGVISAIGVGWFAVATAAGDTGYYRFAMIILVIAFGSGMTFATWMAAFTETVEARNPAATATGLAVWGASVRIAVVLGFTGLIFLIPAANVLVESGHRVTELATRYQPELATLQRLSPAVKAELSMKPEDPAVQAEALGQIANLPTGDVGRVITLQRQQNSPGLTESDQRFLQQNGGRVTDAVTALRAASAVPADDLAYLTVHASEVRTAAHDSPGQWGRLWWLCFAAQVLFLPSIWLLTGRWSPAAARSDAERHRAAVDAELHSAGTR